MKKFVAISLSSLVLCLGSLAFSPLVSAHVLKTDNGVSAVLHIDPDDNPVAATPTTLDLQFGELSGNFSLSDCSCGVMLTQNGKVLQRAKVVPAYFGSAQEGVATITFPAIGIYNILVNGSSANGSIPSFKLDYLERVASGQGAPSSNNGQQILLISFASLVILTIIAHTYIKRGGRYATRPKPRK